MLFHAGHALVIGVGRYADSRWDVPIAADDAVAIRDTLIDPALSAYPPGQVTLLTDAEATKASILAALNALADRVGPDDTVLISFTGHGALGSDKLYYLASHEMSFNGQQILAGSALSAADLGRALKNLRAERVVVLLNACFSGAAAPMLVRGGFVPERLGEPIAEADSRRLVSDASSEERSGRAIITASKPGQLSHFMTDRKQSFFAQALLDALRGGNGSGARSGLIGLFELYDALHRQTQRAVRNALGQEQTPLLTLLQGAGNFALARYPGAAAAQPGELAADVAADLPRNVTVLGDLISASGERATAIKAEAGSNVTVDNRQEAPLISFGNNNSIGDVRVGDVVRGNMTKIGGQIVEDEGVIDPAKLLPRLSREIGSARNVDVDIAADAADVINNALTAFSQGNVARAKKKIQEALEILAPLRANGYVNSRARKLEQVRDVL